MSQHLKNLRHVGGNWPGQKRIRVGDRTMIACVSCKERKQRCDAKIPSCGNCVRLHRACLVEDPATRRQTPRNYLQSLEERIAMLESMLQHVQPDVANDHFSAASEPSHPSTTQVGDASSTFSTSADYIEENEELDDLSSKVGLLALNAPGAEPHYFGSSSAFAFSRVINSSLRRLHAKRVMPQVNGAHDPFAQEALPCLLPDPNIGNMFSRAYFEHIHTQYPFLHEDTFRAWEQNLMSDSELSNVDPVAAFFVNIVYAVGALVLPQTMHGYSSESLYASSQLYLDHVIHLDSLESIQAILCCAMYSLRSPIGISVWSLSGLALRQCIELGYHRSARKFSSSLDPLRVEMRKRVFWCSYGIDRAASMTLGRPFGIPDQEIDVEFPLDIDDCSISNDAVVGHPRLLSTDSPTMMSGAIHTFRLRRIWSRIHTSLYTSVPGNDPQKFNMDTIEQLQQELSDWANATPPQLASPSTALSVFDSRDWFKLAYNHSILLLYRGHLTAQHESSNPRSAHTFLECARAAQEICISYRRLYIGQPMSYTWGALHILFLAGLTYLHCLWSSSEVRDAIRQDDISRTCTACTMVLVVLAERWEQAASYRDIFEALASKTMSMIVVKDRERWMVSNAPATHFESHSLPDSMAQWVTDIADVGMSDGIEDLLSGLVSDVGYETFEQH